MSDILGAFRQFYGGLEWRPLPLGEFLALLEFMKSQAADTEDNDG